MILWHRRIRDAGAPIAQRLYFDYVQRERLDELHRLLRCGLDHGYETMTLSAFAESMALPVQERPERILLLRHDIDSDVRRARRMWEIERRLGAVGSYFFRRSTWDLSLMRELSSAGCEVGYHYEELATAIKERGVTSVEEARELRGVAGAQLSATIDELRATSGLALDVFAAHGDFANRAVGVSNVELLSDVSLRAEIGARLEAYDIEDKLSARSTDGVNRRGWWPTDPEDAFRQLEPVVGLLLHPRSWGGAPIVNARLDLGRIREGGIYRVRCVRRRMSGALPHRERWPAIRRVASAPPRRDLEGDPKAHSAAAATPQSPSHPETGDPQVRG